MSGIYINVSQKCYLTCIHTFFLSSKCHEVTSIENMALEKLVSLDIEIVEQWERLILYTDSLLLYSVGWNCLSVFSMFQFWRPCGITEISWFYKWRYWSVCGLNISLLNVTFPENLWSTYLTVLSKLCW